MRVLVTGGAGFIGSHLCEALTERGYEITVIDDLSTGRVENLSGLVGKGGFEFVENTVRNAELMEQLMNRCEQVYHLAAAVGVQLIVDRPVHTIETNIHGTEVVLEKANKKGRKVLLASTSEVYGKNESVPFAEEDDTVLGSTRFSRWSYACSKAIDEFLGFAYYDQYGLEVVAARLFNTIGPRQVGQYGMVVPRFVKAALRGEPIKIFGTGEQTRCFSYVGDVVQGLIGLMENKVTGGQAYNVGSDEEISIERLAELVIELTESECAKQYISYEKAYGKAFDDMQRRVPNLSKIRACTGYKPVLDLRGTLKLIIEEMKENLA